MSKSLRGLPIAGLFLVANAVANAATFDHSHARFQKVLQAHLQNGAVNYAGLKTNRTELDTYLKEVASVSEAEFKTWSREHKLAFLVNTYNATVLRLVIEHYPLKSIKRIGGLFGSPFRLSIIDLFGQKLSLDDLEHGIIRPQFNEPRVHFALVCAARSCPSLRNEPYTAERLTEQLQAQGKLFLNDPAKNRVDLRTGVIHFSPIFKWFAEDFTTTNGSVVAFVAEYFSAPVREELKQRKFKIKWMDYDWSLNEAVRSNHSR